jgi:hypothetical protein
MSTPYARLGRPARCGLAGKRTRNFPGSLGCAGTASVPYSLQGMSSCPA